MSLTGKREERPSIVLGDRAICILLAIHFSLVLCGAFKYAPWFHVKVLGPILATYGDLTGARYSFGFFAPDIPNPVLAEITYTGYDGETWKDRLGGGTSELDHRTTTMMTFFTVVDTDDLHARTLAAYALGHHPEAEKVTISLRCYRIPTMKEYRAGTRASEDEYYWGEFARASDVNAGLIEKR